MSSSTPTLVDTGSKSDSGMSITSSSFAFIIISIVLLLIVVGCCFGGRRRRGALLGTTLDTTSDPTEQPYGRGGWGRRKLIPPVFWETFLSPPTSTDKVVGAGQSEWPSIQPVSVCLIRACRSRAVCKSAVSMFESAAPADISTVTWPPPNNSQSSATTRRRFAFPFVYFFNFHLLPQQHSHAHPSSASSEKSTEVETENHPEAVKIAVMIYMPSPVFRCRNNGEGPSCHPASPDEALREFQIGIAQVPWTRTSSMLT